MALQDMDMEHDETVCLVSAQYVYDFKTVAELQSKHVQWIDMVAVAAYSNGCFFSRK